MFKSNAGGYGPRVGGALIGVIAIALALTSCTPTIKRVAKATATATTSLDNAQFTKDGCQFSLGAGFVEGKSVTCGYISVPADHSNPQGARIRLAVVIFKNPLVASERSWNTPGVSTPVILTMLPPVNCIRSACEK